MKKLGFRETERLLKRYKIPLVKQFLVKNENQCVKLAKKLGFPLVLKISSPDIIHKTEAKGVLTNMKNEEDLRNGFRKIMKSAKKHNPKARIEGVIVQEMVSGENARELIVGSKIDKQFGPVIMFGLGGIFVEVLKDVSFRLIPIERRDAQEMISELKGFKILQGVRNQKSINFKSLEDVLLKVSKMVEKTKKIKELDINPLFADEKNVRAADVRVLV